MEGETHTSYSITFSRVMNSFNYYILMRCNDAGMTCWKFIPTRNGERPSWLLQFWVSIYSWAKIVWRSEAKRHQFFVWNWMVSTTLITTLNFNEALPLFSLIASNLMWIWDFNGISDKFEISFVLQCHDVLPFLKRKVDTFRYLSKNLKLIWKKSGKVIVKNWKLVVV